MMYVRGEIRFKIARATRYRHLGRFRSLTAFAATKVRIGTLMGCKMPKDHST